MKKESHFLTIMTIIVVVGTILFTDGSSIFSGTFKDFFHSSLFEFIKSLLILTWIYQSICLMHTMIVEKKSKPSLFQIIIGFPAIVIMAILFIPAVLLRLFKGKQISLDWFKTNYLNKNGN